MATSPATLQEALKHIAIMDAAGASLQQELAAAKQQLAAAASAASAAPASAAVAAAPAPVRHFGKIPLPSKFAGKTGQLIVEFIGEVENNIQWGSITGDATQIQYAMAWVTPEVRTWYNMYTTSTAINTWDEFKKAMILRYRPVSGAQQARTRLDMAKQTGSVQQYTEYVQRNVALLESTMSDEDQVYRYITGLKDTIAFEVNKVDPKTLIECIAIANRTEAISMRRPNSSQQSSSSSNGYRSQPPHRTSAPMDINNVNNDFDEYAETQSSPTPSASESRLLAVIARQQAQQLSMQQQLNALFTKSQDHRSTSSTSSTAPSRSGVNKQRIEVPHDVYQKCFAEGRCLKCKETGHIAAQCTKPLRLNF
jgi:hypothetical protein